MIKPTLPQSRLIYRRSVYDGLQPTQQQGVALLTVLLLVVAITVVAGSMLASQKISIRQYELLQTQNQIINDIRAAEQMAAALIKADAKVNDIDSMLDVWAQPIAPTKLATHQVTLTIKDASSQFNINNLYHNGQVDEQAYAVFQRLLAQQGMDRELADAVLEWQGADLESRDGSEEGSTSYSQFLTVDQLAAVKGFTPDIVNQLKPYVTAVPYYLPINLNTATPEVLGALIDGVSAEQFDGFANARKTSPGQKTSALLDEPPLAGLITEQKESLSALVDVKSHGFQVLIDIAVTDLAGDGLGDEKAVKHRYATTFISKLAPDVTPNSTDDNQLTQAGIANVSNQSSTDTISGDTSSTQFQIAPFGTRLWTYRPVF